MLYNRLEKHISWQHLYSLGDKMLGWYGAEAGEVRVGGSLS